MNLNQQLTQVWSSIVRDIGNRLGCDVDPVEFAIDWHKVHRKLLDGLRSTAFNRYLSWFGEVRYLRMEARERRAEAEEELAFRPRKRVRAA
jgi:coproporphyrinogen III oxidase